MNLMNETLVISIFMICLCGLPLLWAGATMYSRWFSLLGTGALTGICFFDLLPDVFHLGGSPTLWMAGGVWAVYSLAHVFHLGHHHGEPSAGTVGRGHVGVFLGSMVVHCFTSGMLLVLSDGLSSGFGRTVFFALIAHKGYEALTVSSVLIDRLHDRARVFLSISLYALALPIGAGLTFYFRSAVTQTLAAVLMSLALGSLLGCLIFDFLIPSFAEAKNRRFDVGWLVLGLCATQFLMRAF